MFKRFSIFSAAAKKQNLQQQFSKTKPQKAIINVRYFSSINDTSRGPYGHLKDSDLNVFEKICGKNNVKTNDLNGFNIDWMGQFKGNSKCVLLPESDEQISKILQHCYSRRLAVVPQSGNTGLVGGSVPVFDEIILSLRKMNKVFKLDNASGK
uniref:FAD-binding PCMH-type domain-containing protein n=1 Tax=Panagrolaimus sp. ES5 TaxID=591445 RepID=A0AC34GXX9_9BILA